MPLTASSSMISMRLQAGEAFVVLMKVDDGEDASGRNFVMSFYGADRAVQHVIQGVQAGDLFEFIKDGVWTESLYDTPGLKIEIAERMKNGRAVIASPTFTVEPSAGSVEDFSNGVMSRSAVLIKASFKPNGVATATAEQILYNPGASNPDPDPDPDPNPDPDPDPTPAAAKFGSTNATWGSSTLKFGATA